MLHNWRVFPGNEFGDGAADRYSQLGLWGSHRGHFFRFRFHLEFVIVKSDRIVCVCVSLSHISHFPI